MNSAEYIKEALNNNGNMPFPFIIAEIGVNHENSMDTARRLIDEALEGGCHAAKFQSYKAATLASRHSPAYWDTSKETTKSQFELFQKHDKFWKTEFEQLKEYCDQAGIEFLSTPFDLESAKFLNPLVHSFKISSSDITNKPFIEAIANYGKSIILSTGASNEDEIVQALSWINDKLPVCLMHCVLNYPTLDQNASLRRISMIRQRWPELVTGYSDHTLPGDMKVLETAFLLGAVMIEKHFTHDKSLPGNDHYHAMDKNDMKQFHQRIKNIDTLLGSFTLNPQESEDLSRANARRSLVAAKDIESGSIITEHDLTWKRPATGISPALIDEVIGKQTLVDIKSDDVLQWDKLK